MFQILLWSPWKYRCGQRTVRMAVVACSQKQKHKSSRAGAAKTRTETCEIVEEKQKLLDMRKEERESTKWSTGRITEIFPGNRWLGPSCEPASDKRKHIEKNR
ncbi:hypothetical protein TNCV_2994741 [Trichonephila clavipes]|nr:hypothetical protein TNCV_2994741 [Trichonephila clavipes]